MRRIKQAKIKFISLVKRGANKIRAIYKEDGSFELPALSKFDDEQGELLNVVYAPETRDSQGDIASAAVIKDMAYEAMRAGVEVDIMHNNKPVGRDKAFVAENFLVAKGDQRFEGWKNNDGEPVDLVGAWASVIKIDDPELRQLYKSGEFEGVSMGGTAVVVPDEDAITKCVEAYLAKKGIVTKPQPDKESVVDESVLKKLLGEALAPVNEELKKTSERLEKLENQKGDQKDPPQDPPKDPAKDDSKDDGPPVFKGDFSDEEAVLKHEFELGLYDIRKDADLTTSEGFRAYREELELYKEEFKEQNGSLPESKPTRSSRRRNGGINKSDGTGGVHMIGNAVVSKAEYDAYAEGVKQARELNKKRHPRAYAQKES